MKTIVVKLGGAVAADAAELVPALARAHRVCVVNGAGPQITAELDLAGVESRFVGGRRVTNAAALEVVRSSLATVNASVCAAIGPRAVPLFGDEIGLAAAPVPALGFVGDPSPSSPRAVEEALAAGLVPVVTPLAAGPLNVNADEAAAALAVGLGAERLLFVTDVPGVLLAGAVATTIDVAEAERLLAGGELRGGIVPKLRAAVRATREGVDSSIGATAVLA